MDFYLHNSYITMSMAEQIWEDSNTMYLSIVWGNMVQKVDEGTPGAKRREYETSDGLKWVKHELHYKNLTGTITGVSIVDGNFGQQLELTLTKWEDTAKVFMSTKSKYFSNFAKKLPNVDLDKEITINSFDFTTSDGKQLRGVDIKQDGEKITDYYWDGKNALHGMPNLGKEDFFKLTKNKQSAFWLEVEDFLIEEVQKVKLPDNVSQPLEIDDWSDVFE